MLLKKKLFEIFTFNLFKKFKIYALIAKGNSVSHVTLVNTCHSNLGLLLIVRHTGADIKPFFNFYNE